jgi:hypothetical protein
MGRVTRLTLGFIGRIPDVDHKSDIKVLEDIIDQLEKCHTDKDARDVQWLAHGDNR